MENFTPHQVINDLDTIFKAVNLLQTDRQRAYLTQDQQWDFIDTAEAAILRMARLGLISDCFELIGYIMRINYSEMHMLKNHQIETTFTTILNKVKRDAQVKATEWEFYEQDEVNAIFQTEFKQQLKIVFKINLFERYIRLLELVVAYTIRMHTDNNIQSQE